MRKHILALLVAVLVLGGFSGTAAAQNVSVDMQFFYSTLAPYGQWVNRISFGWVWVPGGVPVNWRPYTHGRWVYTDDYGWYWVSDWPWGWVPFHYGRWAYDDDYGWVWVPDTVWGPAWVDWRYGDGWIGWAPLPPAAVWQPGIGFSITIVDIERHIRPTGWVFSQERNFGRQHMNRYVELPARNVTILQRTRSVTRYRIERDRIVDRSLDVDKIEKGTGQRFVRYRVREVNSPAEHGLAPRGNEIDVYRPRVIQAPPGARPPPRTPPPGATPERIRQQQEIQRRQLLQQQQTEQQRLQQHYRRQLQTPGPGRSQEQIRRQEQTEMRVLGEEHRREQQLLQRRQQREHPPAQQPQRQKEEKSNERR